MVLLASRPLEVLEHFAEAPDRVIGEASRLPDRVRVRDRVVVSVTQRDRVVVQVEAALRPRVRQAAEAVAEAVVHRRRVLRATEAETDTLSRRIRRLEADRVEVVVGLVVVPLVARLFHRGRRVRLMTPQMYRSALDSESLRINVIR